MKHASEKALDSLEGLLKRIRQTKLLKEKSTGIFYKKSQAFLHFHEDSKGLFADLKVESSWKRFPVNTKQEKDYFLRKVLELTKIHL